MTLLPIAQIVVSILLVVVILLQSQSTSLGGAFGGSGGGWHHTKRGFEKVLFISTIIFAILFLALSITQILIR